MSVETIYMLIHSREDMLLQLLRSALNFPSPDKLEADYDGLSQEGRCKHGGYES